MATAGALAVVVHLPPRRSIRACARFAPAFDDAVFCRHCTWREWLHPVFVSCSSCGDAFEATHKGQCGYSHCDQHAGRRAQ